MGNTTLGEIKSRDSQGNPLNAQGKHITNSAKNYNPPNNQTVEEKKAYDNQYKENKLKKSQQQSEIDKKSAQDNRMSQTQRDSHHSMNSKESYNNDYGNYKSKKNSQNVQKNNHNDHMGENYNQ